MGAKRTRTQAVDISKPEIKVVWARISNYHAKHLASKGIKLPRLRHGGNLTKNAIVLAVLAKYEGKQVSKDDLTRIVSIVSGTPVNDVQQARHLGRQHGWNIESGTRGSGGLDPGYYRLVNLTDSYAGWIPHRTGALTGRVWKKIKADHNSACATCGSIEGQPHRYDPAVTTKLTKGHRDPTKPLSAENAIPQCDSCNRIYQDRFIFDEFGRVADINLQSRKWSHLKKVKK